MAKLGQSNIGHLGAFKNKIINGNFNIWQRATSRDEADGNVYKADRWLTYLNGDAEFTFTQGTTPPTESQIGMKSTYTAKITVDTADVALTSSNYSLLAQKIEGYNFAALKGGNATLSFWVKSSATGIYCVSFLNTGYGYHFIREYTINTADTWEYKTLTVPFGDETAGTWNATTGIGCNVFFCLGAGDTYQNTADVWASGADYCTSNQENFWATGSNVFELSQVQLEKGLVATDFEGRSITQELAMCQRYFYKLTTYKYINRGYGTEGYLNLIFLVTMRVTPTASYTLNADVDHLATSIDGVYGYVTDNWTGTVTLSAGATYDAEL